MRHKLARWAEDNAGKLAVAKPIMPEGFINRVAANWRVLLAIAELAGGAWPERARKAAAALSAAETSLGIKLLSDVRDAFAHAKLARSFNRSRGSGLVRAQSWQTGHQGMDIATAW